MVVTMCRTETMTGQTVVIEFGPLFPLKRFAAAPSRAEINTKDPP